MQPVSWTWAVFDFYRMNIPHVCLWSPSFLPRPRQWDAQIDVAGYTWGHESTFEPSTRLSCFLQTSRPIIAVSFGSASAPDAAKLMATVFEATILVGARAVVCLNGSNLGALKAPDNIYITDQIPHEWLVPQVQAFMHHGGAGHTAVGLRHGVPMLVIPFFLDQYFWAAKIHEQHTGPAALDHRTLTSQQLASRLSDLLSNRYRHWCSRMANHIQSEPDGAEVAAATVTRLQVAAAEAKPSCDILRDLKAIWNDADTGLRLSGAAAACLVSQNVLKWSDLELVPGIDWTERRSQASPKFVLLLDQITYAIYSVLSMITLILRTFVDPWAKRTTVEGDKSVEKEDPVRQVRGQQAEYDLQMIKEHAREGELPCAASIEKQIVTNWRVLSKQRFLAKLAHTKKDGKV
ncbi:MAG: hypothetical protein Q9174_002920 [Haloplaca sp. 1 TL-2023]